MSILQIFARSWKVGTSKTNKRVRRAGQMNARKSWLETLELRCLMAGDIVPWHSAGVYNQFTKDGKPVVMGFGIEDGPDSDHDGKSDATGLQIKPEFAGTEFDTTFNKGFDAGSILGLDLGSYGVDGVIRGKLGVEYGWYLNGGTASTIHSGSFSYDVKEPDANGAIPIQTSVNTVNGNLYTVSPRISAFADLVTKLYADMNLHAFGKTLDLPAIDIDRSTTLLSFNRQVRNLQGQPEFESNGSPKFDNDIKYLNTGITSLIPALASSSGVVAEYQNALKQERLGIIEKQDATLAKEVAKTAPDLQAAQARIDAATASIAAAQATSASLKSKIEDPSNSSFTVGGGEVFQPSLGLASGPLLGAKLDLSVGAGIEDTVDFSAPLGSMQITLPDIQLVDNTRDANGELSASTEDAAFQADSNLVNKTHVMNVDLNLGSLVSGVASVDIAGLTFTRTFADFVLSVTQRFKQSVTVKPDPSTTFIKYVFTDAGTGASATVNASVNGTLKSNITELTFHPGDDVRITPPGLQKIKVASSLSNGYQLSNDIKLNIGVSGQPKVLGIDVSFKGKSLWDSGYAWEPDPLEFGDTDLPGAGFDFNFPIQEPYAKLTDFMIGGPVANLAVSLSSKPDAAGSLQLKSGTPLNGVFTFTVTNNGPQTAENVVFTHTFPEPLVAGTPGPFTFNVGTSTAGGVVTGNAVSFNLGSLANGASATINVGVTITGVNVNNRGLASSAEATTSSRDRDLFDNRTTMDTRVFETIPYDVSFIGDQDPAEFYKSDGITELSDTEIYNLPFVSLRAAVFMANRHPGPDIIYFTTPGALNLLEHGEILVTDSVSIYYTSNTPGSILSLTSAGSLIGSADPKSRLLTFGGVGKNSYYLYGIGGTGGNGKGKEEGNGGAINIDDPDGTAPATRDVLTIQQARFHDNTASTGAVSGGAIHVVNADLNLINVEIDHNIADFGGGILLDGGKLSLQNVNMHDNTANFSGGAIASFVRSSLVNDISIANSSLQNNTATPNGGAAVFQYAPNNGDKAQISFLNTLLSDNNVGLNYQIINAQGSATLLSLGGNVSDDASVGFTGPGDLSNTIPGISLNHVDVVEKLPGAAVGELSVADPLFKLPSIYSVDDNRFEVVGNQLKLKSTTQLDQSISPTVTIKVTATDGKLTYTKAFVLNVLLTNLAPTNLTLSNLTVNENAGAAVIGDLQVTDPNLTESHTFTVDDARFEVVANQLKLRTLDVLVSGSLITQPKPISLDYEKEPSVVVNVTATDTTGLSITKPFTISVVNVKEAPTQINLEKTFVIANSPGVEIGGISTVDPDLEDTIFTYQISDSRFEVLGGKLKLKAGQAIDPATESSITFSVTSTATPGSNKTQSFTLDVAAKLTYPTTTITYTENTPAQLLASFASIQDASTRNYSGGFLKVQITNGGDANDLLEIRNQGTSAGLIGVSGNQISYSGKAFATFTGGTGITPLTIDFTSLGAKPAAAQALFRNLTFRTLGNTPSTTQRKIIINFNNGTGGNLVSQHTVNVIDLQTITAAVTKNAAGQIFVTDPASNNNLLAIRRNGTNLIVSDTSTDPNNVLSLNGVTGATLSASKKSVTIPLSVISNTTKSLIVNTGNGNDVVEFDTNNSFGNGPIPSTGLVVSLGNGDDRLDLVNNPTNNLWTITGAQSGSLTLGAMGTITFNGLERAQGGSGKDVFRLVNTTATNGIAMLDGDSGSNLDSVEVTRNANYTLTNTQLSITAQTAGQVNQSYGLLNIKTAILTGGNSDNFLDASLFSGPVTLNGSEGNDVLLGGSGSDKLNGGNGHDWLSGNAGNDVLIGWNGRDILVGGDGVDQLNDSTSLVSGYGEDILIGGPTSYDMNKTAIDAIMMAWLATDTFVNRIKQLKTTGINAGTIFLNATTVFDDGAADTFFGGLGSDWYFARLTNATGKETTDAAGNELTQTIDL